MTIRHVVSFKWHAPPEADFLAAVGQGFDELPRRIAEIQELLHGPALGLGRQSFDYGLVVTFASRDACQAYLVHPVHLAFFQEVLARRTAEVVSVQFDT